MLDAKTAIVTGASRGIGRAIAIALAKQGINLALIYHGNADAAQEALDEIKGFGVHAKAYCCDVKDFDVAKKTVDSIVDDFKRIDFLINNAGITKDKLLLMMKEPDFDVVLAVNLKGAFNMVKHVSPYMLKARSGRIVNITSIAGMMGNAGQVNYSAAKAGLIGFTKSVARELAPRGITCNAIAPGLIDTDMTKQLNEASKEALLSSIPLKRMGNAQEVGELAAFLCGPHAGYITGEVIRIDGGFAM